MKELSTKKLRKQQRKALRVELINMSLEMFNTIHIFLANIHAIKTSQQIVEDDGTIFKFEKDYEEWMKKYIELLNM